MIIKNETLKAGSSLQEFENNLTFGEYVRLILKADGITQEELANKMNCSKQYINGIINGKDSVTLECAQKISQVLGYSLAPFAEVLLNEQMRKVDPHYTIEITKRAG
jgi:transcriptional regulator with XRE-family HTH domain